MAKSDYWQERFIKEEERRNKDARTYLSSIEKQYDKALRNIEKDINNWYSRLAKNNDISLREAKMLLSKNELEEFKWTVQEYIEKGQENAISKEWMKQLENVSAKVHISKLEALKVQIQNEIEGLYGERLKGMEDYLERIYGDTYYRSAFIIQKGIGIGWSLSVLDTNKVNQIIHKPWAIDEKNFSERIWEDKAKLINTLHTGLTQNIIRGSAPDELIRQISKEFGVKKSVAGRLVMTESAAYSSKAQEQCFKDLDVEKYEIIATLDTSTSAICREMDGKVFQMKDYLVGVTANPFHPNCRTVTAPYFEDDVTSMRAMRTEDGKTEYVSANMKYDEWYKKYVTGEYTAKKNKKNDTMEKSTSSNTQLPVLEISQREIDSQIKNAKTVTEINDLCEGYFSNIKSKIKKVNFEGCDLGVAKENAIKLVDLDSRFESDLIEIKTDIFNNADVSGACRPTDESYEKFLNTKGVSKLDSVIRLNVKNLESRAKVMKDWKEYCFSTPISVSSNAPVDEINAAVSTLVHEYGHSILPGKANEFLLKEGGINSKFTTMVKFYKQYMKELKDLEDEINQIFFSYAGKENGRELGYRASEELRKKYAEIRISAYSTKTVGEFIAEAFCNAELSSNPKKWSIKVHDFIVEYFGK